MKNAFRVRDNKFTDYFRIGTNNKYITELTWR